MNQTKVTDASAEQKENEKEGRQQMVDFGAATVKSSRGTVYILTIIGQIEGHQVLPENTKATKYEHVLPLLASMEEAEDIDGILILLNTVGGDIEAGLAIAELIAGMKTDSVSGAGRRAFHRRAAGGVGPGVDDCAIGVHDHPSRAHDRDGDCRTPDLPLF